MTNYGGVWPAMLTPLNDAGEPNHEELEKLVELFIKQEMDGLYVCGSNGQGPLLNLQQRCAVAERVIKTAAGRIPIIVHVGAIATDDAVAMARHSADLGADAISSVSPIYYSVSVDEVFEHYRQIGAATDLPLFVYHLNHLNTLSIAPSQYVERLLEIPNIAGMKVTGHDLYQFGLIRSYSKGRMQLFSGSDELMCQAAVSGACGAIGKFYNVWGPTCKAVRQAFISGDFTLAQRFMLAFQVVIARLLGSGSQTSFVQSAMRMKYGIEIGPYKSPLGTVAQPWADDEVAQIIASVDEIPESVCRQPPHAAVTA